MNSSQYSPWTQLPWLLFLAWCWYQTLTAQINPLRVATVGIGITVTAIVLLEVWRKFVSMQRTRFLVRLAQFSIGVFGLAFCIGAVVMGATTLAIPNLLTDYWREITLPLIVLLIGSVVVGRGLIMQVWSSLPKHSESSAEQLA